MFTIRLIHSPTSQSCSPGQGQFTETAVYYNACMQSAHILYSEVQLLSPEELGQARLSRGLGNILAGRASLKLAYAQKMADLPLTIPEETTAEANEAQLHDSHYETMWSTQHSKGILETQWETPMETLSDSQPIDSSTSNQAAASASELYYVQAPDSLGMVPLLFI